MSQNEAANNQRPERQAVRKYRSVEAGLVSERRSIEAGFISEGCSVEAGAVSEDHRVEVGIVSCRHIECCSFEAGTIQLSLRCHVQDARQELVVDGFCGSVNHPGRLKPAEHRV